MSTLKEMEAQVLKVKERSRERLKMINQLTEENKELRIQNKFLVDRLEVWAERNFEERQKNINMTVEEVVERRLVKEAVEAQEAVYKTVTVPADERPDDDDTVRLGLIAQDVQTAMSDAGVEFDLVTTGANGKLSVKYSNLVIPLLKAVQELSAEVKALKG